MQQAQAPAPARVAGISPRLEPAAHGIAHTLDQALWPPAASAPAAVSLVTAAVALAVLAGWALDLELLKRIRPDWVAMNPLTALTFLAAAAALWRQCRPAGITPDAAVARRRAIPLLLAALVAGVGAAKLGEHAGWLPPGLDQWLFPSRVAVEPGLPRNEIAPNTAFAFLLTGLALLLLDRGAPHRARPAEWLAAGVALVALVSLLGYAYQVPRMYGVGRYIPMAAHTALLFLLLALGLLCARPHAGTAALFLRDDQHGQVARQLLGGSVLLVATIGWLRLEGERAGLYSTAVGTTLYTAIIIAMFALLLASGFRALRRAEAQRLHAEAERERALAFNRLIMDNALDVICAIDDDGRFVQVSAASRRLWGYAPEELEGRRYLELVHPDDIVRSMQAAQAVMAGQPTLGFSNRYLRKDGTVVELDWSATWSAEAGLMFCAARDATARRAAEQAIRALNAELQASSEQLRQSNRELEAFSYTVSHDLRAPLRHIHGYARMLQEDAADRLDGNCRRYLDEIGAAARRMGALIDDLLAFSRLGRKPLECTQVDMTALAAQVAAELDAGGRVRIASLPEVHADPALLRQVWVNLLSNALKYSAPRGDEARVEVEGERVDDRVRYRVRDNGVGFDMKYADKLFGVFQRLHTADEFEGTGVGLAIVQRIVARHGGTVSARAEPGLGAEFVFELPLPPSTAPEPAA